MTYKVVLVDDESLILRSLEKIIDWESLNCEVAGTANDGQKALSLIKEMKPEVVVTDICMPEMNGLDLLREIQQLQAQPKVILLSGYNDFQYAKEGLRNNAFDYLLKPIDHDELEKCLERVIITYEDEKKKKYDYRKNLIFEALTFGSSLKDDYVYVIVKVEFNKLSLTDEQQIREWANQDIVDTFLDVFFYKVDQSNYLLVFVGSKEDIDIQLKVQSEIQEVTNRISTLMKIAVGKKVIGIDNLYESYLRTSKLHQSASFLKMKWVTEEEIKNEYHSIASPDVAINTAKSYLLENFTKEIGIENVARLVEFSVSHFSVLFKQKTGVTFLDYLTNLRIEHACVLLKTTDLKTYEIAEMVGYSDQRYFSQVFKKRVSVTPSQYRKQGNVS
ncbi:response regulator transcription factor [Halalkalibacter krulwichiae]|uniref:Putative response regulatory protein n=1 Tax=Halalkalibacter krulwichiae TaxID=199441 RepID=A0A1X9ME57_9BACI|nr:response regulator [Halalkalibacter krulwichiae]ARK29821.1 putative response regulatory protein [Halalkalibacter krulwichiae]